LLYLSGSDEALVLEAMLHAYFSVWRIERRHETAGLIVTDALTDQETWLVDEGLSVSAPDGMTFAARVFKVDSFVMTCGVMVPLDQTVIEQVMLDAPTLRAGDPRHVAQDPRLAVAIYRAAIESGMMEHVAYK
jgi:hypothetical protein